jgi:hypothetical protein
MTDADKLAQVIAEHDIYSMPRNLGQYRSAYACACGQEVITDVHRGINRPAAFAAHVAAVLLAHLTAEGWAQGEWEYGVRFTSHIGLVENAYVNEQVARQVHRDREFYGDSECVIRRRVTDWKDAP